jgi:hypothetical protein
MALSSDECVNEGRSKIYDVTTFIRDRIIVRTLGNGKPSNFALIFFHFDPVVPNPGSMSMPFPHWSGRLPSVLCKVQKYPNVLATIIGSLREIKD